MVTPWTVGEAFNALQGRPVQLLFVIVNATMILHF